MSLFNLNPFKKAITIADNIDQLIDDPTRAITSLIDGGLDGFLGEVTGQGFGGDIDRIKAAISAHGGIARNNRFRVRFQAPTSVTKINDSGRDHEFLCESASIPGKQILTSERNVAFRRPELVPYGYTVDNVTLTFICTSDMFYKKLFQNWVDFIVNPRSQVVKYKSSYAVPVSIEILNLQNKPIYNVVLQEAFPLNVNAIELSNGTNDDYIRVSVEMAHTDIDIQISE